MKIEHSNGIVKLLPDGNCGTASVHCGGAIWMFRESNGEIVEGPLNTKIKAEASSNQLSVVQAPTLEEHLSKASKGVWL